MVELHAVTGHYLNIKHHHCWKYHWSRVAASGFDVRNINESPILVGEARYTYRQKGLRYIKGIHFAKIFTNIEFGSKFIIISEDAIFIFLRYLVC